MLTFVTFHVDSSKETAKKIYNQDNKDFRNDYNYILLINLLFRSVSIFHPNCRKVVLTDMNTRLAGLDDDIEVYRTSLDPESIMFSRLVAQFNYVNTQQIDSDIILIDSDMLVNANLEHLFEEDFSVALTYRYLEAVKDMPINGGIIFLSRDRKQEAIKFLEKVYQIYQEKYLKDYQSWWGDQYALIDAIGFDNFHSRQSDVMLVDEQKIKLLDCEIYNFSPGRNPNSIVREHKDKVILHFKGSRKKIMPLYWQAHLSNKENFNLSRLLITLKTTLSLIISWLWAKWTGENYPSINQFFITYKRDFKNWIKRAIQVY